MALATVRAATPDDVDEIIRIQSDTWTTAYAELLPEAALQRLSGPAARRAWAASVSAGKGQHVFVATEGSWTVGFCAASSVEQDDPDDPDPDDTRGTLVTLLVEPRWGRRGHGRRLFEAAAAALRSDGSKSGSAWVPERDVASRAFYARREWTADGLVRVLDAGDREFREIRLVGSLERPPADGRDTEGPSSRDL